MNARQLIDDYDKGKISFPAVVASFQKASFTPRQPTKGDWGAVYARAEMGIDDTDVPGVLAAAEFARQISQDQYDELIDVYRQRVSKGPAMDSADS